MDLVLAITGYGPSTIRLVMAQFDLRLVMAQFDLRLVMAVLDLRLVMAVLDLRLVIIPTLEWSILTTLAIIDESQP